MTTGQFWDLMWSLPWYKRIWFAIVDDVIVFLTIWWVWLLIIIAMFYKELWEMFVFGFKEGKKWVDEKLKKNL